MRILITGGAGFVGSSLAVAFKKDDPGNSVVTFDNLRRRGSEINIARFKKLGIQFVHGDIRNPGDFSELEGNFDLIIEASAEPSVLAGLNGSPGYLLETNLVGTLNCLEYARKHAQSMIFLSTSRVYSIGPLREIALDEGSTRFEISAQQKWPGISSEGISEKFPTHLPRSLYGATKLASELIIQEYANTYGFPAIINRCGVLAGPGQFGKTDQGVFTLWVANHYFQRPLKYTGFGGQGKQVRDLLHPLDLFELLKKQIQSLKSHSGQVFNAGGGRKVSTSMLELTRLCEKATGKSISMTHDLTTSPVDIPMYISDNSHVNQTFSWKPERSVETIVQEIANWMKENESELRPLFT
jgi:CDP-paratose 2-epimerase